MIDLTRLGTPQPDGTIRLFDKNRDYRRIRQSPQQKEYLSNLGYQFVNSSNVSALSVIDNDLYIRFHNGSVYRYPNSANLYETILQSNSKGKAVWKYLRRARKPYEKVGSLPFPKNIQGVVDEQLERLTDSQMFQNIDTQFLYEMTKNVSAVLEDKVSTVNGIQVVAMIIGGERIYIPLALLTI